MNGGYSSVTQVRPFKEDAGSSAITGIIRVSMRQNDNIRNMAGFKNILNMRKENIYDCRSILNCRFEAKIKGFKLKGIKNLYASGV
ncbi:hypothetical protein [uncultured Methanospirillum sp.]|uniref:hypothetical protein n=1 Tax=uncultured Methanospirillum sp. TaxID=262503 RepID=UPI0029C6B445|nr:hypothetical protein [uncultured Methanospirillum sp.]